MKFSELSIVLPCHSLEDFPIHHEGEEAQGLLASWSALWHPALIASAEAMPTWCRADDPPEELACKLLSVPEVSNSLLPAGWTERAESENAVILRGNTCRKEMISTALTALEQDDLIIDQELVADFLALGFGYLQVQLLTRQMRYASSVDEVYFENETKAAALAAVEGDLDSARNHLASCFDILAQARDQYYPVDSYLIDCVLVEPTTIGQSLRDELNADHPINLVLSATTLEQMARREPDTLIALREALQRGSVSIVGGDYGELDLPLLPLESVLDAFRQGSEVYQQHLGIRPQVYGRRKFGLSPMLPQILSKLGYIGAIHFTLDGGRFPQGEQSKIRWESFDGSAIDALARVPLDAARAESYLNFAQRMGDSMDMDHVATVCFARWPGGTNLWHDDLRRIAAFGPALGKFVRLDDYFSTTDMPDLLSRFEADEYLSPYLRQSVDGNASDPISRYVNDHRTRISAEAAQAIRTLTKLVTDETKDSQHVERYEPEGLEAAVKEFQTTMCTEATADQSQSPSGHLIVNPLSQTHRACLEWNETENPPPVADHVRAAGRRDDRTQVVIDVPAMGFSWVGHGSAEDRQATPSSPLAEENLLRNEHFEVIINPTTGAIQAIRTYERRGNVLSAQLAFRDSSSLPPGVAGGGPQVTDRYSVMAADRVEVTASTAAMGEIVSRGRLLDRHGNCQAGYQQTLRLWRGSRVLEMEIELTPESRPGANPWDSYYAVRLAWPDASAVLWRSAGSGSHPTLAKRIEAPQFVEIRGLSSRVTILTGGLPFHVRSGERILDSLLSVRGESQRTFRLGIGVGLTHPMLAATEFLATPKLCAVPSTQPNSGSSGWLFHLDVKNVQATHWEPIISNDKIEGFRVRLLETEGRACRASLSALRSIDSAVQTDFLGEALCDLPLEDEKIMIDFAQYEWVQVEARWK